MTLIVQQPYNMFRSGQVQGETPEQFAAGKQAANSQTGAVSQPVVEQKPAPVVQQPQVQKQQTQPVLDSNSSSAGMDYLNSLYTSPQEEERLRKASVMNQRILAIGDAIRHIGNIANTVNYAPAQQLNSPVQEEYARYERGKALRDKANQQFYTYQQQKAAQDAAQRKWEQQMKYNMDKDARDYQLKKSESEARNNLREAQLNRYQTMMALDEARREGIISDNEYKKRKAELYPSLVQSQIARNNRTGGGRSGSRGGSGSNMPDYDVVTTYERDDEGRVKSAKKTRTVKHSDGTTSTSTKTTKPQKKALPGQAPTQPQKKTKKRLPGM